MNLLDVFKLYGRNAAATFRGGFYDDPHRENYLLPLLWLAHMAALPVTLTAGAGLKTLADVLTREPLSKKQIESLTAKIEAMDSDTFNAVINTIVDYYKEHSTSPSSNSSTALLKLLEDKDRRLNDEQNINYKRQQVVNYLNAQHNNGKELQHVIRHCVYVTLHPKKNLSPAESLSHGEDPFADAVKNEIKRLRKNSQSIFGIGNNKKAAIVETALNDYLIDPSPLTRKVVEDALNRQRLSISHKQTFQAQALLNVNRNLKAQAGSQNPTKAADEEINSNSTLGL